MQRTSILLFLFLLPQLSWSQTNFTGIWEGLITLKNSTNEFDYQLTLTQNGNQVTGTSLARLKGGDKIGSFKVAGEINSKDQLLLKDIEQIEPQTETWCFKELTLWRSDNQMSIWVGGYWSSKNCDSGLIRLQQKKKPSNFEDNKQDILIGKWVGTLTQADEQSALIVEFIFQSKFTGFSIIKGENGSEKIHNLTWKLEGDYLIFKETNEKGKENNKWQWCLKTGKIPLSKTNEEYFLKGSWDGYKSQYSLNPNDCPSGVLHLKKEVN